MREGGTGAVRCHLRLAASGIAAVSAFTASVAIAVRASFRSRQLGRPSSLYHAFGCALTLMSLTFCAGFDAICSSSSSA